MQDFELIYVIVNFGIGSQILKAARRHGISGGTVLLGKGTVNNRILDFLGLSDMQKEIVLMVAERKTAHQALDVLNDEFKFKKPNHGVAFTISVCDVIGARNCKSEYPCEERGVDTSMYQAITVIVEKGNAEQVIDSATRAGSKGGTVIKGRGSGIHETGKLFSMQIEPEKEVVLILSKTETTDFVVSAIREDLKIDEPGHGIIFIQNVNKTYGLYE